MALSINTLTDEFLKIFDSENASFLGWPSTVVQAVDRIAAAYNMYASSAIDVSGDSLVLANLSGFKAALNATLLEIPPSTGGTEVATANAFDAAFVAYWTGATFGIVSLLPGWSSETSSIALAAPGLLAPGLLTEFNKQTTNMTTLAQDLANVFHTATLLVTTTLIGVMLPVPPGTPTTLLLQPIS